MARPAKEPESIYDSSCPFDIAESVLQAVPRADAAILDEGAAWEAFLNSQSAEDREYFEEARRSRRPIHLYQLQRLYAFGIERCTTQRPEEYCAECGRQFMRMFSLSSIRDFLKAALARRGSFQNKIVEMVAAQLERYTGGQYTLSHRISPREISLTLESSRPEAEREYYRRHGLDPDRSFGNSFYFLAGVLDKAFSHIVAGYDPTMAIYSVSGNWGRMVFPVREDGLFTHQTLGQAVVGYIGALVRPRKGEQERRPAQGSAEQGLVIHSKAMKELWERIRRVSRSEETVLLRGESGTGKSLVAGRIHELSDRRGRPFVEVGLTSDIGAENMIQSDLFGHERGAFTGATEQKQGLFSLADGGTIFLDEIGDASSELQAKLLRVIETSTFKRLGGVQDVTVDVRIIAATNRDLEEMVKKGAYRQDLYYRLNVIPIELPPLRDRRADVPPLAAFLLSRATASRPDRQKRLAPGLASGLAAYSWPGNIRELDHALKHANAISDGATITAGDFPAPLREFLEGGAPKPAARGTGDAEGDIINLAALRKTIRSSDPVSVGSSKSPYGIPAHIEHAKRAYLAALIDEFGGDLSLVAKFWDRSSDKTLRKLVKEYGLTGELEAARARGPRPQEA